MAGSGEIKMAGYFPDSPHILQQLLEYKLRLSTSIEFEDDWEFRRIENLWLWPRLKYSSSVLYQLKVIGLNWLIETLGFSTLKIPGWR